MTYNVTKFLDIFKQPANFIAGAMLPWQLPKDNLPEFAYIGKSNVGKSTLVNLITGHGSLARVSKTPGRTRQINFFEVGKKITLVDLPGYGFAEVSNSEKARWEELILHYLENRRVLVGLYILIDGRRGIKENDLAVMDLVVKYGHKFTIIFTKADKLNKTECENLTQEFEKFKLQHADLHNHCRGYILSSSRRQDGAKDVRISMGQQLAEARSKEGDTF